MAELLEIEPGDRAIVDAHAAADDEMAQMRGAGRRDRPEQRVMQAEIARMRQLEHGPGAMTPASSKPRTRAPLTLPHLTTSSMLTAAAPLAARWMCQALFISLIMSADSFDAAPSTASDTAPPSAASLSAGAMPEPRRQFDCGQCAMPVPVSASRRISSSST
jgi:hypothetical protein